MTQASILTWPARAWALIKLGRPIFLTGGFVMHTLGVAMALYSGARLNLRWLILSQIAVTAAHLMTHYLNDYFDIEYDRANQHATNWSGGSRVLVDGTLPAISALIVGVLLALLSLSVGVVLAFDGRAGVLPMLVITVFLAAAYSSPPFRLHTRGLGELTAGIVVAGLVPLIGFIGQTGRFAPLAMIGTLPLICFQMVMLVGVAFPDALGDAESGKRTLVVRMGARAGRLYLGLMAAGYLMLIPMTLLGLPVRVALVMLGSLPLAGRLALRVIRGAWRTVDQHDSLAFGGIALLMCTAVLEIIGFLSLAGDGR